jgi:hypothetical protein
MSTIGTERREPNLTPFIRVRPLFCGDCGYAVVVREDAPECPMCRGHDWQERPGFAHWN